MAGVSCYRAPEFAYHFILREGNMLLNERRSYVGVSGLTQVAESNHLALRLQDGGIPGKQVMAGVTVIRNRAQNRYVAPSLSPVHRFSRVVLEEILTPLVFPWAEGKCFAAIHYTDDAHDFAPALLYLLGGLEGCVHAVQLNIDMPQHAEVATLARVMTGKIPGFRIILQIAEKRINEWEERGDPTSSFLTYIDRYSDVATDVVLHVPGGRNVTLDVAQVGKYLNVFFRWKHQYGSFSSMGIGISGNLTPAHMRQPLFTDFLGKYPELSVDAEYGLRTADARAIDLAMLDAWLVANGARGFTCAIEN